MCDQFLLEIWKLHIFVKCNIYDLRRLFMIIESSHVCVALAEYSGSCWNVFIEDIFVLFLTLFLKKMGIMISASSPHCHSRLSKPILKILSIHIQKIFLGKYFPKQYALNTFSDCFMHQNFKYFLQN